MRYRAKVFNIAPWRRGRAATPPPGITARESFVAAWVRGKFVSMDEILCFPDVTGEVIGDLIGG